MLGITACSDSSGSGNENTQQTSSAAENLDNDEDYEGTADIEKIDKSNTIGTTSKFDPNQKAGKVTALCYYDLADTNKEQAEILAQRFGGIIETTITNQGTAYFDKLGQMVATGHSPDIVRYD